jgi:hypothetical protein
MAVSSQDLDLILETRLDVLAQAVEEVSGVIQAMTDQRDRLAEVEGFLSDEGTLFQAEGKLGVHIGDIESRLSSLQRSPTHPAAGPRRIALERPRPAQPDSERQRLLREMRQRAGRAKREIGELAEERRKAYSSFQDVRRWSVAGLADTALDEAVRDYERLIQEIRKAENPWRRYQAEMPRRGHELFSLYLELLAGMAVRGFGLDTTVVSDADALRETLVEALPRQNKPTGRERSPLALMSSLGGRHMPLGYPEWSLWALPLVGRSVGQLVAASRLPASVDNRLRVICADLYAQYVLGPSYLHAAIFLEFDPSSDPPMPDVPIDSLRAALLLQKLCDSYDGAHRQILEDIAMPVDREWRRVRAAVGGHEPVLDANGYEVVDGFLESVKEEFPEIAFPADDLDDLADASRDLTVAVGPAEERLRVPSMSRRMLLSAMWLARLKNPSQARLIHKRAKAVSEKGQDMSSIRPSRGMQPRVGTWA